MEFFIFCHIILTDSEFIIYTITQLPDTINSFTHALRDQGIGRGQEQDRPGIQNEDAGRKALPATGLTESEYRVWRDSLI